MTKGAVTMKAGIIGCGKIFPMHAVSIKKQPLVQLAAVCDSNGELAEKTGKQYGCSYYTDYQEMIAKEKLDTVHICTPHYLHAEMAIYALEHGIHVLTEKPMAIELKDAKQMEEAAEKNGRVLMVSFQNRFNPGSLLIKKTLEAGELGSILSARASVTWNRSDEYYSKSDWKGTWEKEGGGVIIDQAIHTLDLMNWFIDSEVQWVDATISSRAHKTIKVEDCAEGLIHYKSGLNASFYAMNYYTYDAPVEIELHCEKGMVNLTGEKAVIAFHDGRQLAADRNPMETFDFGNVKQYWGVGHMKEIQNFYSCLAERKHPRNTAGEVMSTQELVCAIYKSGKEGRVIPIKCKSISTP